MKHSASKEIAGFDRIAFSYCTIMILNIGASKTVGHNMDHCMIYSKMNSLILLQIHVFGDVSPNGDETANVSYPVSTHAFLPKNISRLPIIYIFSISDNKISLISII